MRFKDELQKEIYYTSQIYYCYWQIKEISNHNGEPEDPLIAFIDKSIGYNIVSLKSDIKELLMLVNHIIRCKNKLGYEVDNDVKFKEKLKAIKK